MFDYWAERFVHLILLFNSMAVPREHSPSIRGRITVQLVSSLTRLDLTKKIICCYLNEVKQLHPNL